MIFMSLSLGKILISSLKTEFLKFQKNYHFRNIKTFEFFVFNRFIKIIQVDLFNIL